MVIMTLQDTFEAREFGPPRDDKWEDGDDFGAPIVSQAQDSFDVRRPAVVAEVRSEIEKFFVDVSRQADADLL
jgi:hypothetical protein